MWLLGFSVDRVTCQWAQWAIVWVFEGHLSQVWRCVKLSGGFVDGWSSECDVLWKGFSYITIMLIKHLSDSALSAPFTLCITWIFAYIHIRLMIIRYILRQLIWLIASRWDVSTWRNNNRNSETVFRFPRGKNIWIWGDLGILKLSVMTIRFPFERHPALSNVVYWTAPK